ncbi:sigma 54 modulation/S30EA ribosomal C-terminal domain-containing protein [Nocardia sp. NBC_00508]|uniref:sigma 54 modulation/S30EA ribosomal C-terminal domain-containing protein n=1 Tax=Nocardia sp. NBC_00508 TaxID=2975992 RepID=UPI002E816248|nr:sigma 54 modulation/S30EA ribosomal C-terminal domain-containing protein [Nocardia sp. NBC_00508]WUD65558.1 sigma 54 modulation/S30EA ribosomal C-terminal domain-containing protein [Nocardia sp. NBC_00508]
MYSELWSGAARPVVTVRTKGSVDSAEIAGSVQSIGQVMHGRHIDETARIRLTGPPDGAGLMLAQANTAYRDMPIRVQIAGPHRFIAAFVAERLDRLITRLGDEPGARLWPDPARPPLASATSPRPIVRRKECELLVGEPGAAARVMDVMDYDAYLFTDAETGEDAIVHWGGPLGVRLARQRRMQPPQCPTAVPLAMNPHPTLRLTEAEAAARLCRFGLPFLFFTDPRSDRGRLLLRRYDGNLTLVAPAGFGDDADGRCAVS